MSDDQEPKSLDRDVPELSPPFAQLPEWMQARIRAAYGNLHEQTKARRMRILEALLGPDFSFDEHCDPSEPDPSAPSNKS
jgi:hypothetical protein